MLHDRNSQSFLPAMRNNKYCTKRKQRCFCVPRKSARGERTSYQTRSLSTVNRRTSITVQQAAEASIPARVHKSISAQQPFSEVTCLKTLLSCISANTACARGPKIAFHAHTAIERKRNVEKQCARCSSEYNHRAGSSRSYPRTPTRPDSQHRITQRLST